MSEDQITNWHQTIDFDDLMKEARRHLIQLSGDLWTDHNSSDPGITMMEVLAFCIADLSYRTSFGVKDIMAGYKGGKLLDIDLPSPASALSGRPVTIKDLRKVLLDMQHPDDPEKLLIRNAAPTIATESENAFYVVSQEHSESFLSYTDQFTFGLPVQTIPHPDSDGKSNQKSIRKMTTGESWDHISDEYPVFDKPQKGKYDHVERIELNGLYDLQIDFEENIDLPKESHLRNLNQNYFQQEVISEGITYRLTVLLPYWDEIPWSLKDIDLSNTSMTYRVRKNQQDYFLAVDKLNYDDYFYDYYAELNLDNHLVTAYIKQDANTPLRSKIQVNGIDYHFSVKFLDWNEFSNGVNRNYQQASMLPIADANVGMHLMKNVSVGDENIFDIRTDYRFPKGNDFKEITLLMRIIFDHEGEGFPQDQQVISVFQAEITSLIDQQIALEKEIYKQFKEPTSIIYQNYQEKLKEVYRLLYDQNKGIWQYLNSHRNLCEDFSKLSASRVQEIALFGRLIVSPGLNINQLLAEVYFKIDQFLHPLVKFHSLGEMVGMGYSFDELFDGPLLAHGFISDEDLQTLRRKQVIYTSDLIRIIMDVEGVEAVEDFNISSYIDNRLLGRNVINCLSLTNPDVYKPKFSFDKSDLQVIVNGNPEAIDKGFTEIFYDSRLLDQRREQIPAGPPEALSLPVGSNMEIEKYYSIQHDFPEIYGIGTFGLPLESDEKRKAQARQLKAYLIPFEQLLANYLKHVAHLPELFSFNRTVDSTYATQSLYEIPDVAPIFSEISSHQQTWDAFRQDMQNTYQLAMADGESEEEFLSRRNRFLSHQLARFGESFHEYALQQFHLHKDLLNTPQGIPVYQQKRKETLRQLIDDKISFAEDYEKVSGQRSGGFNLMANVGPQQEIGFYKLRICRLLGLDTAYHQNIFGVGANGSDLEGLQVLEHILLRPRTQSSQFLTLTNRIDEEGKSYLYQSDKDPYSFRVTIVLPVEAGRFRHKSYREFVERLIRMETPAHVLVDFKWLTSSCGMQFEKSFVAWKNKIAEMVPHYFQGQAMIVKDPNGIPLNNSQFPEEILQLQDQLVHTLETPCKLDMTLYDDQHRPFLAINQQVKFNDGITDIFNIRVSETGGMLTIEKWIQDEGAWITRDSFQSISQTYFPFVSVVENAVDGLTQYYGGVGNYKITYELNGRTVIQYLIVNAVREMPKIYIGNQELMLDFDTEKDGVFERTSDNLKGYFLQFSPGNGEVYLQKTGESVKEEVMLTKGVDNLSFTTILAQYGPGSFEITYELNGFIAFALIEIEPVLEITITDDKKILLADETGITTIPWQAEKIMAYFDLPGGDLKVYQIDAQPSFMGRPDQLDGSIYHQKQIEKMAIDMRVDKIWNPGLSYDLVYSLSGISVTRRIFIEAKKVPVKPLLSLWRNDEPVDNGTIIDAKNLDQYHMKASPIGGRLIVKNDREGTLLNMELESEVISLLALPQLHEQKTVIKATYALEGMEDYQANTWFTIINKEPDVKPAIQLMLGDEPIDQGSVISIDDLDAYFLRLSPVNGQLVITDEAGNEIIKQQMTTNLFSLADLLSIDLQANLYKAVYTFDKQPDISATTWFTIKQKVDLKTSIGLYQEDEQVADGETFPIRNLGMYHLKVAPTGGRLTIFDELGNDHLNIVMDSNWYNLSDLAIAEGENRQYEAIYTMNDQEAIIRFNIIGEVYQTEQVGVEVINTASDELLLPEGEFYTLLFDSRQKEMSFQFRFNKAPGSLSIREEEETIFSSGLDDGLISLTAEDLPSDNYYVTYQVDGTDTFVFKLKVINIDPEFGFSKITREEDHYKVSLMPLKPDGRTYIWRMEGKYFSRAKYPSKILNFVTKESCELSLTIHWED
ncbi:MAG: hypothetical protein AAFQ94_16955 [Bacteroidota bacterium]